MVVEICHALVFLAQNGGERRGKDMDVPNSSGLVTLSQRFFPACQFGSKVVNNLLGQTLCTSAICHYALLLFLQLASVRFLISVLSPKACVQLNCSLAVVLR